jgi:hypothetical protein
MYIVSEILLGNVETVTLEKKTTGLRVSHEDVTSALLKFLREVISVDICSGGFS